jgi:hypothetical protein
MTARFLLALLGCLALCACHKPGALHKPATPEQAKAQEKVQQDQGLPIPLTLPPDSDTPQDVDLLPPNYNGGSTTWTAPFVNAIGFEKVVASFDGQLKQQHFFRLGGPQFDVDPGFKMSDTIRPVTASGKKAWISADKKIVVLLTFEYRRGDKGPGEVNSYKLSVLKSDQPQAIKAPNKVFPIP